MTAFIKHGGVYVEPKEIFVKSGGVFHRAREGYVKHNGLWAKFWPNSGSLGDAQWPAGGTYEFTVPYYTTLSVEVAGGGGGNQYSGGGHGKQSRFNSDVPLIGDPGAHGYQDFVPAWINGGWWPVAVDRNGAAGKAYGGDQNITGGAGNGTGGNRAGGPGGLTRKTWTKGAAQAPVPGTKISLVVGLGGGGGAGNGWVRVNWA